MIGEKVLSTYLYVYVQYLSYQDYLWVMLAFFTWLLNQSFCVRYLRSFLFVCNNNNFKKTHGVSEMHWRSRGIAARGQIYMGAPIGVVNRHLQLELAVPVKAAPIAPPPPSLLRHWFNVSYSSMSCWCSKYYRLEWGQKVYM